MNDAPPLAHRDHAEHTTGAAGDALSKRRLKLWVRMLSVTRKTEAQLRDYLRREHGTTLPRFDVMAALRRRGEPVTMGELSRMLLVSNGNATDVVGRLEAEGLAVRIPCVEDRRTVRAALTDQGRTLFDRMAAGHEAEVARIFAPLDDDDLDAARDVLRKLTR